MSRNCLYKVVDNEERLMFLDSAKSHSFIQRNNRKAKVDISEPEDPRGRVKPGMTDGGRGLNGEGSRGY
jgi:hypothetical protein